MLRIRMARRGAVHRPFDRVVVNDSARTPDARNVAELGFYDPRKTPPVLRLDVTKTEEWIRKGAVPSSRILSILKKAKAEKKAE